MSDIIIKRKNNLEEKKLPFITRRVYYISTYDYVAKSNVNEYLLGALALLMFIDSLLANKLSCMQDLFVSCDLYRV